MEKVECFFLFFFFFAPLFLSSLFLFSSLGREREHSKKKCSEQKRGEKKVEKKTFSSSTLTIDHALDTARGPRQARDPVQLAILLRSRGVPGAEDCGDCLSEGLAGVVREIKASVEIDAFVTRDDLGEVVGRELDVLFCPDFFFHALHLRFEARMRDVEHYIREHI